MDRYLEAFTEIIRDIRRLEQRIHRLETGQGGEGAGLPDPSDEGSLLYSTHDYNASYDEWDGELVHPGGAGYFLKSTAAGIEWSTEAEFTLANFASATELTINGGSITATQTYHTVDTEGDAANDDLDTVAGGSEGDLLILRAENAGRTVTCKDGTGNLLLAGDFDLDDTADTIMLIYDGSNWLELSRSNNA